MGSNPVSWVSKKQFTVFRSSTKAEYPALAATMAELSWIHQLLCDLFVFLPIAPLLFCDNQSALQLAQNPVLHGRTKHVEVDFHFVRKKVASKDIHLRFVSSHSQPTELFTKVVSSDRLIFLRKKLMPQSTFV